MMYYLIKKRQFFEKNITYIMFLPLSAGEEMAGFSMGTLASSLLILHIKQNDR